MHRTVWATAVKLLCSCLVTTSFATESVVLKLTAENFRQAVLGNPLMLVKFYAPWCGHCNQLAPEYEKAAHVLQHIGVQLAECDATVETALAAEYRVEGYPTLYFFRNGEPEEYAGGRENATIVKWVQDNAGAALTVVPTAAKLDELLLERPNITALPYFVARGPPSLQQVFGRIAEEHRGLGGGTFWYLSETPQTGRGDGGVVQVHRGVDEVVEMQQAGFPDSSGILRFLRDEMLPPFGEVGEDNFEPYLSRASAGMLWACFDPDTLRADVARHASVFREIGLTFKQFPVVYMDTKIYQEHVREELGCIEFPTAVLQLGNFTDRDVNPKRYKLPLTSDSITVSGLQSWIEAVLAGQVAEDLGTDGIDDDEEDEDEDELIDATGTAVADDL